MLHKIEELSTLELVVMKDGKPTRLKLVVKERAGASFFYKYEYIYLAEDGKTYARSTYSGGATGSGISSLYTLSEGETIYTSDLATMNELADRLQHEANKCAEAAEEARRIRVEHINALPKEFPVPTLPEVKVTRDDAKYYPGRQIQGYLVSVVVKENNIYLYRYTRNDGALMVAKFTKDLPSLGLSKAAERMTPREMLTRIVSTTKMVTELIRTTK